LVNVILLFTPWAFGTTEDWAIQTATALNFVLGGLLIGKWIVRVATGFNPPRWNDSNSAKGDHVAWIPIGMAALTLLILGYIALSAWNARAEFLPEAMRFEYFESSKDWLPRSYDKSATWRAFLIYSGMAFFFWSLRDWLRTKTRDDLRVHGEEDDTSDRRHIRGEGARSLPTRLKRLIWVLCVNGAILAVEGTLQRLSGSNELLWLVKPNLNEVARAQFGPFNYRSNGAQYLNMLWPISLGFWWALHRRRQGKLGQGPEMILLLFTGIMLAAPIIANSRGGVAVAIAQSIFAIAAFGFAFRKGAMWKTLIVGVGFLIVVGSVGAFQWKAIQGRMRENTFNSLSGRTEIYQNARKIAIDFPTWGSGPGTFPAVYSLYRDNADQLWYAQAHDDYLETRVTFGWVGLAMILCLLLLAFASSLAGRGIPSSPHFIHLLWTAAGGCLLHAKFDFPFQIYSLMLLFLTLCAIMTALRKR